MRRSASEIARWSALGLAAVLLVGCSNDPGDTASEPGLVLSSSDATLTPTPTPSGQAGGDHDAGDDRDDDTGHDDGAADDDVVLRDAPTVVDDTAEIDVEDQRGDGSSVRVDEVRFSTGTGIVGIYDAGLKLLGWSVVKSGVKPVTVELDRTLGSSQELLAVLHRDDGDGQLGSGDPVVVEEGEQVSEDFDYVLN